MMVGMGLRYRSTKSLFWVSLRRPLMVGCRCRSHRNRRRISDGQVAGSNVGFEASSSGGRLTLVSLKQPFS